MILKFHMISPPTYNHHQKTNVKCLTKALKVRLITAMGVTHGFEVSYGFLLPPMITIRKQESNA